MLELRIYSNFPIRELILAKRVSFRTDYKYVICGNYVVLYKIWKRVCGDLPGGESASGYYADIYIKLQ